MTNEGNPPEGGQDSQRSPPVSMTNETQASVADLDVDAIAGVNSKVKALVVMVNDLEEKTKKLEEDKKKGDEALTELEAQKKKELEDMTKVITEAYGDGTKDVLGEEPTEDMIKSHFKVVEALKAKDQEETQAPPAAGEASQGNGTSQILNIPGENVTAPPHNTKNSIGDVCKIEAYKPRTREDYK